MRWWSRWSRDWTWRNGRLTLTRGRVWWPWQKQCEAAGKVLAPVLAPPSSPLTILCQCERLALRLHAPVLAPPRYRLPSLLLPVLHWSSSVSASILLWAYTLRAQHGSDGWIERWLQNHPAPQKQRERERLTESTLHIPPPRQTGATPPSQIYDDHFFLLSS